MTTYSYAQLEELWIQAGGSKAMAPLMAAIAEVESGGDSTATNPSGATGLWQIEWPLYRGLVPGATSREAYFNPLINARAAVALSRNDPSVARGSPVYTNWIQWETTDYHQFLKGGVAPSGPVPAATGTSGTAQLTSFNIGDVLDPFTVFNDAARSIGSLLTGPADIATSVTRLAKDFNAVAGVFVQGVKAFEWLFVPGHWVRVGAFFFGTGFLVAGTWALMRTGTGKSGDITLSLGIMLTVIAAMLLFIAFHNLPDDVRNVGQLLGWISRSIRQGSAALS